MRVSGQRRDALYFQLAHDITLMDFDGGLRNELFKPKEKQLSRL